MSIGYEYQLFESLNPICQTAEYDRSTGYAYGNRPIGLPMQSPRGGGKFSLGSMPSPCSPLAGAGVGSIAPMAERLESGAVNVVSQNSVPILRFCVKNESANTYGSL